MNRVDVARTRETGNKSLNSSQNANPSICPECRSKLIWKDGFRYTNTRTVQRWICRECSYRFSHNDNNQKHNTISRRVCETLADGSKNLVEVETRIKKQAAGATKIDSTSSRLLEYAWHEKKRGLAKSTIKQRIYRLKRLVKYGAELYNPDTISNILALEDWTPANKKMFATAYKSYTQFARIEWEEPRIQVPQKLPFIPTEQEIDQLIAGCGKKTATFLQVLKDTGTRASEASRIKWIDVNPEDRTIRLTSPTKGSLPRIIKVSPKIIAMINAMSKTRDYIFNTNVHTTQTTFSKQRNRLARVLQNPRLKQIRLHTFRHWFATMLYHRTKDILYVKAQLGHKRIKNTEIYTHLIEFKKEEFHVSTANNLEEESKLLEAGFEFVRFSEKDDIAIYRKRK